MSEYSIYDNINDNYLNNNINKKELNENNNINNDSEQINNNINNDYIDIEVVSLAG